MPKYAPLEPGDPTSLGTYELVGRLGAGGQGAVYLGRAANGDFVAIKLLHSQMNADPQARARFVREVAAAQKVEPFCTAQVLEAEVNGDRPYVVSEYIEGPSLHEQVAQQGPRPPQELRLLATGMLTALAAIHEVGIVHRDFKPNNVLISQRDGSPRVVDFGIARTVNSQESAVTATGMVVGTPGYLAPEQLTGAPLQPAVDIFAFGATMVFAATGQSPFEADSLPVIINRILNDNPDLSALPDSLRPLIARCLDKDSANRPSALEALVELVPQAAAAPREELLNQGTQIASQLPAPAPVQTPQPFGQQPYPSPGQQPYAASSGQQPYATAGPASPQPFAPPSPQPFQQPGPSTPPPMQMGSPQGTPPPFQQSGFHQGPPPNYQQQPPPPNFQQQPPNFQPHTPPPFQPGTPQPFQTPPARPFTPQPPKSTNGPAIAIIGCAVLLVLALLLVIVLVLASDDDKSGPIVQPSPAPTRSLVEPSPTSNGTWQSEQPSYTDTAFIAQYAGTWRGTVRKKLLSEGGYIETVTIEKGATTGTVKYENAPDDTSGPWTCTGTVTFVRHNTKAVWASIVTEQLTDDAGGKCQVAGWGTMFVDTDGDTLYHSAYKTEADADAHDLKDHEGAANLKRQ